MKIDLFLGYILKIKSNPQSKILLKFDQLSSYIDEYQSKYMKFISTSFDFEI